jgi:hypothetical protein
MAIHGAVVMDFLFIQPFGWIHVIIAWGRKSQNNPSDLNTRELCGDHNKSMTYMYESSEHCKFYQGYCIIKYSAYILI